MPLKLALTLLFVCSACDASQDAAVIGESPAECEPLPSAPAEDFTKVPPPTTIALLRLPVIDPDCEAATTRARTTEHVSWQRGAADAVTQLVAAITHSEVSRSGDVCHVQLTVAYSADFVGRSGTLWLCDRAMISPDWGTLADVAVSLDALAINDAAQPATSTLAWAAAPGPGSCVVIGAGAALALTLSVELHLAIADWQRLVGTSPPALAVRLAIHEQG